MKKIQFCKYAGSYFTAVAAALILLAAIGVQSCKKKTDEPPFTSMTLLVAGDSTWTVTDVTTTRNSDGSVTITGNNSDKYETIELTLKDYRDGRKTYNIGNGGSSGINFGSTATYKHGGYLSAATEGQVVVANFTTKSLEGTFSFANNSVRVSGSFIAPLP